MSANPLERPVVEAGPPTPQQMLALLQRVSAEAAEMRERLLHLTEELDVATRRLDQHFGGTHLTAVAPASPASPPPPATPPTPELDPRTPAVSVAIEMAVAGFSRSEVRTRLTRDFAIAAPDAILDGVFGAAR